MDYPGKVITKTQVTPTQTSASGNWTLDDQAAAIKNNNWPVALVPNPISKSLRFNSADTAYLNRTLTVSSTSSTTCTWSGWVKRSALAAARTFVAYHGNTAGTGNMINMEFVSDTLRIYFDGAGSTGIQTTAVYRDPSAWYHIILAYDSTQATSSNRAKLYINGIQVTAFTTANYPSLNQAINAASTNIQLLGAAPGPSNLFNGYMTEINFIDGQALTPSSFGMTNPQTGQWIPLKYSGTYGTNGFYLNFKDATSTTTLGYDYSGNANNWTTNNFSVTAGAGNDSLTDVPTPWIAYNTTGDVGGVFRGNYATLNPLKIYGANFTYSNGNLQVTDSSSSYVASIPTLPPPNSGKWYWEVTVLSQTTASTVILGLATEANAYSTNAGTMASYGRYRSDGDITNLAGTTQTSGSSYTTNDVIGVALDVDSGTVRFYKNGTAQGATPSFSFTAGTVLVPYVVGDNTAGTKTLALNFGQRPFAYTPPTGFRSLCTTNLPATAIGFGLTNQGKNYFDATLYTGTGSQQSITGLGFQPDFFWSKGRSAGNAHVLINAVNGPTKFLSSNNTDAEVTTTNGTLVSFDSTGVTLQADTNGYANFSGRTYVAWNWKASGSTVSNTAGTITSTVSANTTAGFSIVTYTGNGNSYPTGATVGHGLGVTPSMVIIKCRGTSATFWPVYHISTGATNHVVLNNAFLAGATDAFNRTNPTSTVFSVGQNTPSNETNASGGTYVAYCFAAVPGYSAFGSYTGNGSSDGPFIFTNFRSRFLLTKRTDTTSNWIIYDSARDTYNAEVLRLFPDLSNAEQNAGGIDFLSNGFKLRDNGPSQNASGGTYIYMAFAESPFQFSNAR